MRSHVIDKKDWLQHRADILRRMQEVMGPLPGPERLVPLKPEVLEEENQAGFIRRKITFQVELGDRLWAYLLLPEGTIEKRPAMLCLHQTTPLGKAEPAGLGGKPNLHYARELAERGYVCLVPDYPNKGEYKADPYALGYASATMKGIWNHMRALNFLGTLPEVDASRIGCIGHSLGGHNTLFVAAFDERIKALVVSSGFTSFRQYKGGNLAGWAHAGYMPRITSIYGNDPARMPFDFDDVLATIAPRPLFINAPLQETNLKVEGVRECVEAVKPIYASFRAEQNLTVMHPDCGHDFPGEIRQAAYCFLDSVL